MHSSGSLGIASTLSAHDPEVATASSQASPPGAPLQPLLELREARAHAAGARALEGRQRAVEATCLDEVAPSVEILFDFGCGTTPVLVGLNCLALLPAAAAINAWRRATSACVTLEVCEPLLAPFSLAFAASSSASSSCLSFLAASLESAFASLSRALSCFARMCLSDSLQEAASASTATSSSRASSFSCCLAFLLRPPRAI
eukprot:CAMPEP_0179136258 /NCGR_PEP_ID=MMETSP0796-20121207/64918_1 /TAXON_ID=73915 /ORGANISM="Pyrodinium bahamense, Strain pbaha01" /LENGTH=201 /DNA_ID=CAMNT_0020835325 /DNA_START=180 /DNA_END=784 /DNA_ORIENTATION=-